MDRFHILWERYNPNNPFRLGRIEGRKIAYFHMQRRRCRPQELNLPTWTPATEWERGWIAGYTFVCNIGVKA